MQGIRSDLTERIEGVRAGLTAEVERVRAEIARSQASVIRWGAGLLVDQAGVIVALIKILP